MTALSPRTSRSLAWPHGRSSPSQFGQVRRQATSSVSTAAGSVPTINTAELRLRQEGPSRDPVKDHWREGLCASGAGDRDPRRPRLARRRRIRSCSAKTSPPMCARSRRRSRWRQQPRRCLKRAALNRAPVLGAGLRLARTFANPARERWLTQTARRGATLTAKRLGGRHRGRGFAGRHTPATPSGWASRDARGDTIQVRREVLLPGM
jgi:hypothetical protein